MKAAALQACDVNLRLALRFLPISVDSDSGAASLPALLVIGS
jgi:hypothetical protein